MKKLLLLAWLWPVVVSAQPAPIIVSSLKTTSTAVDSVQVGCAIGSSTCTGGIKAGPIAGTTGTFTGAVSGTTGTFSGAGIINSTTTGNKTLTLGGSPADNSAAFFKLIASNSVTNWQIGTNATLSGALEFTPSTAGGGSTFTTPLMTLSSGGVLGISSLAAPSGTTARWGINAGGDWTIGASVKVVDSVGTPAVSACGTTPGIVGKDYAFTISTGTTATTSCTVTLSQSYPVICTGNFGNIAQGALGVSASGATVTFTYASATSAIIYAHCRGI